MKDRLKPGKYRTLKNEKTQKPEEGETETAGKHKE